MSSKKQVIVIHGGDFFDSRAEFVASLQKEKITKEDLLGKSAKRWKDNLLEDLGSEYEVLAPEMPNPHDAKYAEWKIWFEKVIPFMEKEVILVGHSLGGIFLARYLSENRFPSKIKGLFLVAAPYFTPGKNGMNANAGFTVPKTLKKIEASAESIVLYHSEDDPIVKVSHVKRYAKALSKARQIVFKDRGHFRQERFPEVIEAIRNL